MFKQFHTKVPVFAIAVIASVGATALAGHYARAGALKDVEHFVLFTFSGSSTGPIAVALNKSIGPSLEGTSNKGNGIVGRTKLNNDFTGATGILGQDLGTANAHANAGVGGTSTQGTGVYGNSTDGEGMFGSSNSSVGVDGRSTSNYGVAGTSTSGIGVIGEGVVGVAGAGSAQSVLALGQGGELYQGISNGGREVFDVMDDGSIFANGKITGGNSIDQTIGVEGHGINFGVFGYAEAGPIATGVGAQSHGGNIYAGFSSNGQVFSVDSDGNVSISGVIFTNGSCANGCAKPGNPAGRHLASFTEAESEPTIEDFGEGQLRDGSAFVSIAADFSNSIDKNAAYMVFLSPEGDTRGLFVTNKTSRGFAVHENQGGRSTVAFSYRIVAKRYGVAQQRLPMVDVPTAPHLAQHTPRKPSTFGRIVPRPAALPKPIIHR